MRKRWKEPKIHSPTKERPYFWFRITNFFGKKEVFKLASYNQARNKLAEVHNLFLNTIYDTPIDRIPIEWAINFTISQNNELSNLSVDRYTDYNNAFLEFLREKYPKLKFVDEIRQEHIQDYMKYRQAKGRANKTINCERQFLKDVWECLIEQGKVPEYNLVTKRRNNPIVLTKPFGDEPVRVHRVIPKEELIKLFNGAIELSRKEGIDYYTLYLTLYLIGSRRNSVRLMEESWVDLESNVFRIQKIKGKKKKEKLVPIKSELRPYIAKAKERAIQEKRKLLFPNLDGKVLHKNKIRDKIIEICKIVGIPKLTPHDFRHTFGSNPNLSQTTKQKVGLWEDKQTLERVYNNPPEKIVQEEYDNWDVGFLPKPPEDYLIRTH